MVEERISSRGCLAMVDNRKGIWPQKHCTSYLTWTVLHSSSCAAIPVLLSEKNIVGWCLIECMERGESKEKLANAGLFNW